MSSRISVRRCRRADLRAVLKIERSSFGAGAWPRQLFLDLLEDCPELFLVARVALRIRGYAATCAIRGGAEIVSIAVDPGARGKGIATAMMRHTLASLRKRGIARCWLTVRVSNTGAIRFYRAFGFVRARLVRDYYGSHADGWRMRLELSGKASPQ